MTGSDRGGVEMRVGALVGAGGTRVALVAPNAAWTTGRTRAGDRVTRNATAGTIAGTDVDARC
jgi:hypothetical protein